VLKVKGKRTVREFHRAIGAICWDKVGMARNEAACKQAIAEIRRCAMSSGRTSASRARQQPQSRPRLRRPRRRLHGVRRSAGARCARAPRIVRRPLPRGISRRPTAKRHATTTSTRYVAAWEFKGVGDRPKLHKEPLVFEEVHPTQRSYK
jgi:succinate dehydrogenase / fumarate reductase flavoprotein subunit